MRGRTSSCTELARHCGSNNNTIHNVARIHSAYYVQERILSTFHTFPHLILLATVHGKYYSFHLTKEDICSMKFCPQIFSITLLPLESSKLNSMKDSLTVAAMMGLGKGIKKYISQKGR